MIIFKPQEKPEQALTAWTAVCKEINATSFNSTIKHGLGRTDWFWYEK
jgi:hypothetical protein